MRHTRILVALITLAALFGPAKASAAKTYTPVGDCNVPILMSDGATMRANVAYPKEKGRYPLVLEITGYNKDASGYAGNCSPVNAALVEKGYAAMVVDDRGTGASEGRWDRYGPRTRQDYGEILDWIQQQRWSNGRVATTGTSYSAGTAMMIGIEDQKRLAAGKPRAVRAIWANLVMSDMFRDYPHVGGFVNMTFTLPWLGIVGGTSAPPPTTTGEDLNAVSTWLAHWMNVKDMHAPLTAGSLLGNDKAYDSNWYQSHSPGTGAERLDIPIAWTGGWFDIFLRGEVDYWTRLKRAPVKKMWMNPIYHGVGGANHFEEQGYGTQAEVVQKWWDRWLKGEQNQVERLPSVNLWEMGKERWYHGEDWPDVRYTALYPDGGKSASANSLNDGNLSVRPGSPGQDSLPFQYATGACTRSSAHWGLGESVPQCAADNRTDEATALTYTTPALKKDMRVSGSITADLWAEVSAPDTSFIVRLLDVAPDGTSKEVAGGWLVGRFRGLDERRTLRDVGGDIIRPYHPFTKESERLLTPNIPTRFPIEVYPTDNTFLKGHRLRISITTSDFPAMAVPEPWLEDMAGGEIRLLRGKGYPSRILLPVVR